MAKPKYNTEGILKTSGLFILEDTYSTRRRLVSSADGN